MTIHKTFHKRSVMVLLFLLISRVLAMCLMPLNDSTEARYGEIARVMLDSGNWVTPMQRLGEPFWAKPPLSTWLSAFSMKLFGVNEFAARMPSLLLSIGILWLVWDLAKKRCGLDAAMVAVLVLAGSLFFFLNAGTVMTDPSLVFCTTLVFIAFWHAVSFQSRVWGYLFFVGLGLGLLAKGPIALVLTGMPIFFWVLIHNRWMQLWQRLPWIKGSLLMLLIALPWYVLAEIRTPGFLNYFIVGEHISRFLTPGWSGDKYGFAHVAPLGMIWVYAVAGVFPWSIVGFVWLTRHAKTLPGLCKTNDHWISYLLLCTLAPLLFFTFSRNIIYPYVFPSLPPFALLFASLAAHGLLSSKAYNRFIICASISGVIFIIVSALFVFKPALVEKSQVRVIAAFNKQVPAAGSKLVYWSSKTDFSAQYYSSGTAFSTLDENELIRLLSGNVRHYVVINSAERTPLPESVRAHLIRIATIPVGKNTYTLYSVGRT